MTPDHPAAAQRSRPPQARGTRRARAARAGPLTRERWGSVRARRQALPHLQQDTRGGRPRSRVRDAQGGRSPSPPGDERDGASLEQPGTGAQPVDAQPSMFARHKRCWKQRCVACPPHGAPEIHAAGACPFPTHNCLRRSTTPIVCASIPTGGEAPPRMQANSASPGPTLS